MTLLYDLRKEANLTQIELAIKAKVSENSVYASENRLRETRQKILKRIIAALAKEIPGLNEQDTLRQVLQERLDYGIISEASGS